MGAEILRVCEDRCLLASIHYEEESLYTSSSVDVHISIELLPRSHL